MGFSIGSAITGAISGAATGFLGGGPVGAIAGGVLGGAAGGFGLGPTQPGGITGLSQGQGAQQGIEARGYYDEAFPGTNPWERLGAGNPIGALGSAAISADTARRNTDVQARSATSVAVVNAASHLNAAKIAGRASAAQTAMNYPSGNTKALGDYVAEGTGGGPITPVTMAEGARQREATVAERGVTAQESQAKSARMNAWTNENLMKIKSGELTLAKGRAFGDPGTAKLGALASQAFDIGMSQSEFLKWMNDNPKKLAAAGVAVRVSGAAGRMLTGIFGRGSLKVKSKFNPTSVGGR